MDVTPNDAIPCPRLTINAYNGDTIDGQSSKTLTSDGEVCILINRENETEWKTESIENTAIVNEVKNYENLTVTGAKGEFMVDNGEELVVTKVEYEQRA